MRALPKTVWALGLVSMFMDISSEMVHALLPLFLTTTLGASVALVGLIDGVAESTASISKVFSGYLSDRFGRRKPLILLGYGLGALTKPLFALATSPALVLGARFADRIGKGLRGAPRDALIADVTPAELRGRAFGVRQALDTAGAVLGPLAAIILMSVFGDMRLVFWAAAVPAFFCVLMILFGVRESRAARAAPAPLIDLKLARALGPFFWRVALLGVLFSLARFSEAFLVLKAHDAGLGLAQAPLVFIAMNLVYALAAYPAGAAADRLGPRRLLGGGLALLLAADAVLAFAPGILPVFLGVALWGGFLALTQGVFSKMVADAAPPELRATAFGAFYFLTGLALLAGNLCAGALWDRFGPSTTFIAGGIFALGAGALLALNRRRATSSASSPPPSDGGHIPRR